MSVVGIVVALEQEGRSLTRQRLKQGQVVQLDHHRLLAVSDTGPEAAGRAAAMLAAAGAEALISWGCAGGLDPGLHPGDLVLPTELVQTNGIGTLINRGWADRVSNRLQTTLPVHRGKLLESDVIVSDAAAKVRLFQDTSAIALDMESAGIGRAAEQLGLPFLALRTIVDPASVSLPSTIAGAFDARGRLRLTRLMTGCLLRPWHIPHMVQLGQHFSQAMATLARVDAIIGSDLLCGH